MASGLYEYSVAPNLNGKNKVLYSILRVFNVINIIICGVSFFLAFFLDNTFWILFAIFLIAVILVNIFLKAYYSAYDCVFIDETVRIDRVFNNRRKRLISFECKNIRQIGGVSFKNYENHLKSKQYKKINLTNKEIFSNDFYFIVDKNNLSYIITFRFNEKFLSYILRSVNTRIVEKEYKDLLVK